MTDILNALREAGWEKDPSNNSKSATLTDCTSSSSEKARQSRDTSKKCHQERKKNKRVGVTSHYMVRQSIEEEI